MIGIETVLAGIIGKIVSDPKVQAMVFGLIVKMAVDYLKKEFVVLDAEGTKQYTVPVQLLVAVCSMAASLGDLYLKSQLHTYDPTLIANFITGTLPIYLNALGIHLIHQNIKDSGKGSDSGSKAPTKKESKDVSGQ